MMASRSGQPAPPWVEAVPASPTTIFLVRAAENMPRLRRLCEEEGPVPLRKRRPELPEGLAVVIHRALSRRPEDRYSDVTAFGNALRPFSVE